MKKIFAIGISAFLVISATATVFASEAVPFAEETQSTCSIGNCNAGECFLDADNDGICDHYDHCFLDENGDGICDNHCYIDENTDGICDYFIDADNDGICDHCHEHDKPKQAYCEPATATPKKNGCHGSHCNRSGHHGGRH